MQREKPAESSLELPKLWHPRSSKWLKIAGGEKAQVLKAAAEASPGGLEVHDAGRCEFYRASKAALGT